METLVGYSCEEEIATIVMDDTKVNALSHEMISQLNQALDLAEKESRVTVLSGRHGYLSAGFDLSVMKSGPSALRELVRAGADLLLRIYEYPRPFMIACTGHAMAAGALMLLAADYRLGLSGSFKIGLNEVSIGMPVPIVGVEMARQRLMPRYLHRATALAEVFDPEGAVEAGYLDRAVKEDQLKGAIRETALHMLRLKDPAFEITRAHLRRAGGDYIRRTLEADLSGLEL